MSYAHNKQKLWRISISVSTLVGIFGDLCPVPLGSTPLSRMQVCAKSQIDSRRITARALRYPSASVSPHFKDSDVIWYILSSLSRDSLIFISVIVRRSNLSPKSSSLMWRRPKHSGICEVYSPQRQTKYKQEQTRDSTDRVMIQ